MNAQRLGLFCQVVLCNQLVVGERGELIRGDGGSRSSEPVQGLSGRLESVCNHSSDYTTHTLIHSISNTFSQYSNTRGLGCNAVGCRLTHRGSHAVLGRGGDRGEDSPIVGRMWSRLNRDFKKG